MFGIIFSRILCHFKEWKTESRNCSDLKTREKRVFGLFLQVGFCRFIEI